MSRVTFEQDFFDWIEFAHSLFCGVEHFAPIILD
jgi:hypothetical protein